MEALKGGKSPSQGIRNVGTRSWLGLASWIPWQVPVHTSSRPFDKVMCQLLTQTGIHRNACCVLTTKQKIIGSKNRGICNMYQKSAMTTSLNMQKYFAQLQPSHSYANHTVNRCSRGRTIRMHGWTHSVRTVFPLNLILTYVLLSAVPMSKN
jgi:hypothetical protein